VSAIKPISLSDIKIDGGTQSRKKLSQGLVNEYAELMNAGVQFPPIVLFHDGSTNWLADGFHRYHAARKATLTGMHADIRIGTKEDALWFSIGANKANGTRPSNGDVKHAVELALRTWPDRSQREIARQVGCHQTRVSQLAIELKNALQLNRPATVTGKDGKTYPTSKASGKTSAQTEARTDSDDHEAEAQATNTPPKSRGVALAYSMKAISFLQQIPSDDALRDQALDDVVEWINYNR
jgi:ParB-like chromosome segregation protein Spo0J